MKTKEEILQRKKEINEILNGDMKDVDIQALETEVKELNEELARIESVEALRESTKTDETETNEGHQSDERNFKNKEEKRDSNLGNFRKANEPDEKSESRHFDDYLETRDITMDGLKTDKGYVVVPKEESKKIIELAEDIVSLKKLVTVKKVSTPSGKQPIRTTAKAKLSTVAELAESPAIGVTPFTEVAYDITTKRGYIPYSEEYKQDGINLVPDLKQFIGEVVVNTENEDILTELKTTRAKTVATVDELKTLVNTGFSAGKRNVIKFLVPQTVFDNLDRIKDKNGRYLLQESISSSTGYKLLGKDIEVLDDSYFPTKTTMFVGDLKEIVYFDRADVRVQWTNYLHFGECLGVAIRNDVGKVEDVKTKVNIYKVTVDIPTDYVEPTEPVVPLP